MDRHWRLARMGVPRYRGLHCLQLRSRSPGAYLCALGRPPWPGRGRPVPTPALLPQPAPSPIHCQRCFEPASALAVVTPNRPEPPQSASQPECQLCLIAFQGPRESCPHVVVLGLQPLKPLKLIRASEFWGCLLCQGEEILGVNPLDLLGLCALFELLAGELVDGL